MRRRVLLSLYVAVVVAGAAGGLLWAMSQWGRAPLGVWELALFIALAGALDLLVVPVAGGGGAAASFAVLFAGLLSVGPEITCWVAALAMLWSEGVVRRSPLGRTLFNSSHSVLSLLAAGWVYQGLGGKVGGVDLGPSLPAVAGAAGCLWLLETGWVASAVALERGGKMWRRLRSSLAPMLTLDAALASVGLLLALLYQSRRQLLGEGQGGWPSLQSSLLLVAITFIPSALLYYAYRLQGQLRRVYAQSLRTLGSLMEAKVEGSQPGHGERVAGLAARLAESLELSPEQVEQIRYAGYLHDIGKVGVPAPLLQRSRDVFAGEPQPMRLHPELGAHILAPIHFLGPAAAIVRAHHERWDGLGYPEGLREHQIPLGARVLALTNAYVGMTHTSAHPTLPPQQAISRLREAAGSRFDPLLLDMLAVALHLRAGRRVESEQLPPAAALNPPPESSPDPSSWR